MNGFLVLFNKVIHITQPSCSCDLGQLIVATWSILSQKHQKTEHVSEILLTETKGTFHVQISAPPGRSYELLNRPVPPERGWTSSPGQTGRCARRDTPSSIGQRREQLSKEHHAQQIEEQEVPTCTEWILHPVTIKGNGTRLSLHMVNNQAK